MWKHGVKHLLFFPIIVEYIGDGDDQYANRYKYLSLIPINEKTEMIEKYKEE